MPFFVNSSKRMKTLFFPRKGKIVLVIKLSGKEALFTTPYEAINWNGSQLRFSGRDARRKNEVLAELERSAYIIFDHLVKIGVQPSAQIIRKVLKDLTKNNLPVDAESINRISLSISETKGSLITVRQLLEMHIKRKIEVDKVSSGTVTSYNVRQNKILQFLHYENTPELLANNLTEAHLTRLADFCLRDCKSYYTAKVVWFLQEAVRIFRKRGEISTPDLDGFEMQVERVVDLRCLELHELERLENLTLFGIQDNVRDLYVLCCYTGFHYVDREGLEESEHVVIRDSGVWIFKPRQKTGEVAMVKLHPKAVKIIDKYGGINKLPKIDLHMNNKLLKVIGAKAGIEISLSTKIARKTFANLCLNYWNYDLETTAAFMGLKSIEMVKMYAKVQINRLEKVVSW